MITDNTKIALIHEWLVNYAGAEQVSSAILDCFPHAELYSVIDFLNDEQRKHFMGKKAVTTFIQLMPGARKHYRKYLPLMPYAMEQLDVSAADIVISNSHAVAKGILTGPDQLHISYVQSPIRYAWDLQHQYLRDSGLDKRLRGVVAKYLLHKIRLWDYRTANGVDHFVANSNFIARRIKKVYNRNADVIYPPVKVGGFEVLANKENYYLTASRMVPYKKIDLIVEAFNTMPEKRLIVIGEGPEYKKIKNKSARNIELLGYQPFSVLKYYMQQAKAFVFAAEEDFGIAPVEAQACGTPVIAFAKGGALETVIPLPARNATGIFFAQQNALSIINAVNEFELSRDKITPAACRHNAERFSKQRFDAEFKNYIENRWDDFTRSKQIIW